MAWISQLYGSLMFTDRAKTDRLLTRQQRRDPSLGQLGAPRGRLQALLKGLVHQVDLMICVGRVEFDPFHREKYVGEVPKALVFFGFLGGIA